MLQSLPFINWYEEMMLNKIKNLVYYRASEFLTHFFQSIVLGIDYLIHLVFFASIFFIC